MKRVVLVEDLMNETPSTIYRLLDNLATHQFGRKSKVRIVAEVLDEK